MAERSDRERRKQASYFDLFQSLSMDVQNQRLEIMTNDWHANGDKH